MERRPGKTAQWGKGEEKWEREWMVRIGRSDVRKTMSGQTEVKSMLKGRLRGRQREYGDEGELGAERKVRASRLGGSHETSGARGFCGEGQQSPSGKRKQMV